MIQDMEEVYNTLQRNGSYNSTQHKEIYLEYPFSNSKGGEKPLLIKELAEKWILDIKNTLRPSSYACYQNNMEKYILPYIGEMPACFFNADVLSRTLQILKQKNNTKENKAEPFSKYTLYLLENIVRTMFRYGAENGFIPEIHFGKAEYTIKNKKEAMPLSELETHQLMCIMDRKEMDVQLQVLLPLYTGISLSELCGLKWKDIDFESGRVHIHRNLVRVKQKIKETEVSETNTKSNNSSRTGISKDNVFKNKKIQPATILAECELPENECREFVIPEKLRTLLQAVYMKKKPEKESYVAEVNKKTGRKKEAIVKEKKTAKTETLQDKADNGKGQEEYIKYPPPDSRTLQYRLKNIGETAWIEGLNYQRLRDTFAVLCLQAGGDVYSVAYILGVGTAVVCERYKHWLVKNDCFLKGIG